MFLHTKSKCNLKQYVKFSRFLRKGVLLLQQFANTCVTGGLDPTNQFEWITESGRLQMIGAATETFDFINATTT